MITSRQLHRLRSLSDDALRECLERWRSGRRAMPPPPTNGTPTSNEAAHRARRFAPTQRQRVLAVLQDGPKTQEEISISADITRSSVCARCRELERLGLITKTSATRLTISETPAVVYELVGI